MFVHPHSLPLHAAVALSRGGLIYNLVWADAHTGLYKMMK